MNRRAALLLLGVAALCCLGGEPVAGQIRPTKGAADEIQDVVFVGGPTPLLVRFHVHIDGKPFRAGWNEFVDRVWKHLDKDGDGVLSPAELESMPPPSLLFGGNAGSASTLVRQYLNANPNHKFTRGQALQAFFTSQGGAPFQLQGARNDDYALAVRVELELARARLGSTANVRGDSVNDALFRALDTDQDGKLSAKELAAAETLLARYDFDDDEMIGQEELVPRVGGGRYVLTRLSLSERVAPAPSWLVPVDPGDRPDILGLRLLERYRAPDTEPKNPAQKLSREQIALEPAEFARLDVNKDGWLDKDELGGFAERAPDVEFRVRVGRQSQQPLFEPLSPKTPGLIRAGQAGQAWVLQRGGLRILFALPTPDPKKQPPRPGLLANIKNTFKNLDRDKNGYLDRKEAEPSALFRSLFTAMDKDGDGKLSESEIVDFLRPWAEFRDQAERSCVSVSSSEESKGLFDLADSDGDGRLSVRELRRLPRLLEQHDHNKDGYLDKHELPHLFRLVLRHGPGEFSRSTALEHAALLQLAALEAAGVRPSAAPPAQEPAAGPLWFRKMDRNRDGDVSRREFLGTDEEFRRIDADGDGLISREEADRYEAKMRNKR